MHTIDKALDIFRTQIADYQKHCKDAAGNVVSDNKAFFMSFLPFARGGSGQSGYHRAESFLSLLNSNADEGMFPTTEDLIRDAINYPDKGKRLSVFIWKAIRESAGFTFAHVNLEAEISGKSIMPDGKWGFTEWDTNPAKCVLAAEEKINNSITAKDFGQTLLGELDAKLNVKFNMSLQNAIELKRIKI